MLCTSMTVLRLCGIVLSFEKPGWKYMVKARANAMAMPYLGGRRGKFM